VWQDSDISSGSTVNDSPTSRARVDGDAATIQRMLDNVRNISGNGKCGQAMVKTFQPLGDTVYVSGARLISGQNVGMYLWRITVRPGPPGEKLSLVQASRNDIPKIIVLNDTITTETPHGNRGVWLLTKSPAVPQYTIA